MTAQAEHLAGGAIVFRVPYRRAWVNHVKLAVPSDHRQWDPEDKCWTVWPPYAQDVLAFTRRTFGFVRETNVPGADAGDHFRVLHLRETAPLPLIEAAYRTLAKICHPDHGGDHGTMQQINDAYAELKARVSA